ncbi:hypothetical protein DNU06_08790 [Putridiphycobacter roseus]|uniref:PKD domain-containing protein n=1 Tax=Putridiphycobacter roseus TaxID=2219161 RepID=A0A2W1MZL6_9FLAO|nr:PKD domain-containing protein [Putridiphycobacter roseus]PZE17357.1 hypothetical protein DNU06_08790 [Putridiphycobacter roseus]
MKFLKELLLCLFFATFYNQSVYAQTSDINEGCLPLAINFTAPAGSSTFFWEFGDGSTANIANPSNTYITAGTFTVNFREVAGGPIIGNITIDVYPTPIPTFTLNNEQGCAPLNVSFNNTTVLNNGITITSLSWVFSNGGNTTGTNPVYFFPSAGSYDVSLSLVTNLASCNASLQYNNVINSSTPPNVSFLTSPNPPMGCVSPLNVNFQNTSTSLWGPLTYAWDFGNTNTATTTNPQGQQFTTGQSQVVLVATDTNGCADSSFTMVNVGEPLASFEISDTICINTLANIVNLSSPGLYNWSTDPSGTFVFTGGAQVSFNSGGYHDITLTISGACPKDTTITVFVEDIDPSFTSTPDFACQEPMLIQYTPTDLNAASYLWTVADTLLTTTTPLFSYTTGDTNAYSINGEIIITTTLQMTTAFGCVGVAVQVDTLNKPNAIIIPDVVDGCVPLSVEFNDSSASFSDITNWEWHFGDGTVVTSATDQNQSHTYTSTGEFNAFLIITNANGCKDTSYFVTIAVGDVLTPNFSVSNTDICPGESILFTDITAGPLADSVDAWHYYSEDARQFSCFDVANPSWSYYHESGPQDVTMVVGFNGCYSQTTQTALINVKGPIADFKYSIDCDTPLDVLFESTSQDATTLSWSFDDLTTSTALSPTHTFANSGDYYVKLVASNASTGCADDSITFLVQARNLSAAIAYDTLWCAGTEFTIDASNSVDVFESCNMGYTWFFSDSTMRPLMTEKPIDSVLFNQPGMNEVMLVVRDIHNCKDTAWAFVNTYGVTPIISMSDSSICTPDTLNFISLSYADTTIASWIWNFPDNDSAFVENPTHIFVPDSNVVGNVPVGLEITDVLGCKTKTTLNLDIYKPVSTITVPDITICSGTTVQFQASDFTTYGSSLTYEWDFDDSNTSTIQNPLNTFVQAGEYHVNMAIAEIASGCLDTSSIIITVADYPVADFSSSVDSILFVCPDDNVIFTNTSTAINAASYSWDFGNGLNSSIINPGTVFDTNGTYTVQLIVTLNSPFGCSDTINKLIMVQQPSGDFMTDLGLDTICRLGIVTFDITDSISVGDYYWDFGDGKGAGAVSPVSNQYTFVPPGGQTLAKLIMTNVDGSCPLTRTKPINIFDVKADFIRNGNDIDTAICPMPYPLQNNANNANSYYWDFGDGQTSTLENPGAHNYDTTGTFDVLLGIKNNTLTCTDTIVKSIIIYPNPIIELQGDTICEGDFASVMNLVTDTSYSYVWTSDPVFLVNNANTQIVNDKPTSNTNYYLTVTNAYGCTVSDFTSVKVYNPINIPDFDTTIVIGDSIFLPMPYDGTHYTIIWDPSNGLSCLECPNPFVQPLVQTSYQLVITDEIGCFTDEALYVIKIHPETFISLPTTFTPNGDGNNDLIYVEGWGIKELMEYKIFNRWGELIFETDDINVGWDGYYKGMLQNNDVYLVQVKAMTWRNEQKSYESYINLMR